MLRRIFAQRPATMGYRELLKKYVRFLELNVGDNFIETIADSAEPILSERDLRELRALAAEIFRESHEAPERTRVENWNYRLRLLLNHHGLTVQDTAAITGEDAERIRAWRSQPRSTNYQRMSEADFDAVLRAVEAHVAGRSVAGATAETSS